MPRRPFGRDRKSYRRSSLIRGRVKAVQENTKDANTFKVGFTSVDKDCSTCHQLKNRPRLVGRRPYHAVRNSITDLLNWTGFCSIAK